MDAREAGEGSARSVAMRTISSLLKRLSGFFGSGGGGVSAAAVCGSAGTEAPPVRGHGSETVGSSDVAVDDNVASSYSSEPQVHPYPCLVFVGRPVRVLYPYPYP